MLGSQDFDNVMTLLVNIFGVRNVAGLKVQGDVIYGDRGYNLDKTWAYGFNTTETVKQGPNCPFASGIDPQKAHGRRIINADGPMCQYWAERDFKEGGRAMKEFALCSKSGTGKVTMLRTTQASLGPKFWTLVTRSARKADIMSEIFQPAHDTHHDEEESDEDDGEIENYHIYPEEQGLHVYYSELILLYS